MYAEYASTAISVITRPRSRPVAGERSEGEDLCTDRGYLTARCVGAAAAECRSSEADKRRESAGRCASCHSVSIRSRQAKAQAGPRETPEKILCRPIAARRLRTIWKTRKYKSGRY